MIRIAVCDDNRSFVNFMSNAVEQEFGSYTKERFEIEKYISSELLLSHHKIKPFDVIFLDIDMPEINGFELAANVSNAYIIFVTSHPELVYDSFYFRPLNFITKENDSYFSDKLHSVIQQLCNEMKQNTTIVLENKEIGRTAIMIKEIIYIKSFKHYVIYYSEGREPITIRANMGETEKYFSAYDFIRIHKSYLVNLRHVFNLDKNKDELKLKNGSRLPMSKNYKKIVDKELTNYLRRTK